MKFAQLTPTLRYMVTLILAGISVCAAAAEPPGTRIGTYDPNTPAAGQEFGAAVAATKKHVAIGAPGAATAFVRLFDAKAGNPVWTFSTSQGDPVTSFGAALSASKDLMIGEPGAETGYGHRASLKILGDVEEYMLAESGSEFGFSVLAGKKVLGVGAPNADATQADAGKAFFYDPKTGLELFGGPKNAVIPQSNQRYGAALAAPAKLLAVGAPGLETPTSTGGTVYLYDSKLGSLATPPLTAANGGVTNVDGLWGAALGGGKKLLAIGAPNASVGAVKTGLVRVFDPKTLTLMATVLTKSTGAADGDKFGAAVCVYGKRIAVGAPGDDDVSVDDSGRVYVFDAATLVLIDEIENPHPVANGRFGASLASDGKALYVGAPGNEAEVGIKSGRAYKFVSP